jgi:hypothetical protein
MYQSPQKKSSSWTPASIHKKSKNFSKPGSSAVQPKRDANSAESQDMPSYSKAAGDLLAGSIMRSVETQEQEQVETSTVQRQSDSGRAAVAAIAPPIVSIPVVQPNAVGIQTKLTVGAPGDAYEQEADRVAAQVMSMPVAAAAPPQVQRFGEEHSPIQMYSSLARSITPVVQRRVDQPVQMYSLVQRAFQAGGTQGSGDLESRLNASKGGGNALAPEVRAFMEPRFGADFSSVRVHTGGEAVQMNRELGAQAFAHGSDVYFGAGKSPGNNELTAHELTHVVQQGGGIEFPVQRQPELMASTQLPALPSFIPASVLRRIGSRVSQKVLWQTFWKVVIKRFGIRGTAAAAISLADGPLPVGELISIGIAIATLWDLFRLWNELWEQTATEVVKNPQAVTPSEEEDDTRDKPIPLDQDQDENSRYLYAFGNKTNPRPPRELKDIPVDGEGYVNGQPERGERWPKGASTFGDPKLAPIKGHYHRIPRNAPMPPLAVMADGRDVGGPHGSTHHTIFPIERMLFLTFSQLFMSLPWIYAGKKN